MPISNHEYGQMGNFEVYTTFNKNLGQTAPSAWKCPKTQLWGPLTNWKFELSPRRPTHSDPIINKRTEQLKKLDMDLSWHALISVKNTLSHWKARIWLSWLSKKFKTHPPKPPEVEPSFRKVSLLPAKLRMLFPAHLWVREFWLQIYTPSHRPWIEACCPKF